MPPDPAATCAIAVIAKAPRPGFVKTRLQALLRPEEAAALGTAFLRDTMAKLVRAGQRASIHPVIAYAPAGEERRFDGILPDGAALLLADGEGGDAAGVEGFGRVLLHATRALFAQGYGAVCVLGADSPTLPEAELVRAATLLLSGETDAVLGRAEDGGYYLLGLTAPHDLAYARIRWSTEHAGADTAARLAEANLRVEELVPWYDVDDPPALRRLVSELDGAGAGHTSEAAARIGLAGRLGGT